MVDVDDKDRRLLNILLENARLSFREIAKKAKVSVVTSLNRVKNLEKSGVINSYTARIDYEKLGYDFGVIVKMRVSKGKMVEVEKKISTDPGVFAVYDVTGDFDSMIIARFKNRRLMDTFIKKIQTYDFVERTETIMILNTIKEDNVRI